MSWIFGSIDFETYGVRIAHSTGVLDMPKLKHKGHDWLDEDGLDYWQTDTKYDDRTFTLNCFMICETGYADFKTKWQTFVDAVKASGKVNFQTPYFDIDNCLINGLTIVRETNYVQDLQIGTFSITITVHGDADYNLITTKRWNSTDGTTYPEILKTSNAKISKDLQGSMTLDMTVESNRKLDIMPWDYIDYEYANSGNVTDRFVLASEPPYKKLSTNKYVYTLTFNFYGAELLTRADYLNDLKEAEFSQWGTIEDILDNIIWNYLRRGYGTGQFTKGTVVATEGKNHQFNNENCLEVLQRMCSEYKLEFEFEKNDPDFWDYTINIKEKVANDKAVTLAYGKGNGQYELSRGKRVDDDFFSVLYAFGAAKNLPVGYRNGMRRLSFDDNPLKDVTTPDPEKEKILKFDEIFPRRTATVTGYTQVLEADLTAEQKEVWPNGIYKVADSTMFDLNAKWEDTDADFNEYLLTHESVLRADYTNSVVGNTKYLLAGQTAKIVMKTGDASGYEFSISKYNHDTHEFYLIPFRDESDTLLPNDVAKPAIGDDYTLVNIDMPASYVTAAEAELRAKAVEALAEGSTPKFPYSAVIDPKFVADNTLYFEVGDRLTIVDTDYDVNGTFRISRLVYNDYTRRYELTFAERRSLNRLQTIEKSVEKQERTASATNADSVENIRNSQITVGDLSRTLLDPVDKKLNADAVVRNKSIDPGMLSLDAGTLQWSLKNALYEPNVDDNEDKVKLNAGTITLHNYNTLSRYEIAKLKAGGGTYDPTRTWNIPETTYTLPTKDDYAIYLKLDLTAESTTVTVEFSTTHIEAKYEIADNILRINLGNTGAGEE
nr:hypothetical protein [uncultured Draconibacterium sp.]